MSVPWQQRGGLIENSGEDLLRVRVYLDDGRLFWQALVVPGKNLALPPETAGMALEAEFLPHSRPLDWPAPGRDTGSHDATERAAGTRDRGPLELTCPDCGSTLVDVARNFGPAKGGSLGPGEEMMCGACRAEFKLADAAFVEATPA